MKFVANVMFLGLKQAFTKDGTAAFNIDIYVPGGDHWQFFVRDVPEKKAMLNKLSNMSVGSLVDVSFRVGRNSKGTYIVLDDLA